MFRLRTSSTNEGKVVKWTELVKQLISILRVKALSVRRLNPTKGMLIQQLEDNISSCVYVTAKSAKTIGSSTRICVRSGFIFRIEIR
jgi:hypothetical protein